jgi:hypothetical protein
MKAIGKVKYRTRPEIESKLIIEDVNGKDGWKSFELGGIGGIFTTSDKSVDILVVAGTLDGLNDILYLFEKLCKRAKKSLRFLELKSEELKRILISRGFKKTPYGDGVEKAIK